MTCKRHSSGQRVAGLQEPCGQPVATASAVLRSLGKGRHPNPKLWQKRIRVEAFDASDILAEGDDGASVGHPTAKADGA